MPKPLRVHPTQNGRVREEPDPRMPRLSTPVRDHSNAERGVVPHASLLQLVLSGGVLVCLIVGFLFLMLDETSSASDNVSPPRCTLGDTYLTTLRILERGNQWAAAAQTAEAALQNETLQTARACQAHRARLTEKGLTYQLHALLAQEPAYLDVASQTQQVKRYQYLREQAQAAGNRFPASLAVAKRAKANGHYRLAKLAYEEAFREGAFSQADTRIMREYEEVLFRQGWWLAQGSGSIKTEGLQLLAARYALDQANGLAHGYAWAELRKYCGPDERTWPKPIATPLLAETP